MVLHMNQDVTQGPMGLKAGPDVKWGQDSADSLGGIVDIWYGDKGCRFSSFCRRGESTSAMLVDDVVRGVIL